MEKKQIIKQMYKYIASNDTMRPMFNGVHFYENRCCATDTHVLVIYNETIKELADKTIDANGEEIKGRWPNVDAVFPKEKTEYPRALDLGQLRIALNWYVRKPTSSKDDVVVIEHKAVKIEMLRRVFNIIDFAGELGETKMFKTEGGSAVVIESPSFLCLIMPTMFDEQEVDKKAESGVIMPQTLSYENLINDYAFNSWRKDETKNEDWMSKY